MRRLELWHLAGLDSATLAVYDLLDGRQCLVLAASLAPLTRSPLPGDWPRPPPFFPTHIHHRCRGMEAQTTLFFWPWLVYVAYLLSVRTYACTAGKPCYVYVCICKYASADIAQDHYAANLSAVQAPPVERAFCLVAWVWFGLVSPRLVRPSRRNHGPWVMSAYVAIQVGR
ncbi:hypothetical protein F4861DRAFT_109511 [Xylaria intraflava]|nr:hypothetical protein F4861DRAFT_109511 [Xylaria intraflava]